MATIVTPTTEHVHESDSSSINLIVGLLIVLALATLFFLVGLPAIRSAAAPAQAPQINVPDKINVDVNPNAAPAH